MIWETEVQSQVDSYNPNEGLRDLFYTNSLSIIFKNLYINNYTLYTPGDQ